MLIWHKGTLQTRCRHPSVNFLSDYMGTVMAVVGHVGSRSHVFVVVMVMALAASGWIQEGKLLLCVVETEHSGVQVHTALGVESRSLHHIWCIILLIILTSH